jgi:YidC/Oxa1 family membrane protein insertase
VERRLIVAILLMVVVAIAPSLFWSPKRRAPAAAGRDTSAAPAVTAPQDTQRPAPPVALPTDRPPAAAAPASDTVWVTSPLYRLGFSTRGGALVSAELTQFRSFSPRDSGSVVQLVPAGRPFLVHRLVVGGDTASLAGWSFTPSATEVAVGSTPTQLTFTASRGAAQVTLEYRFAPNDYRFEVRGRVSGLGPTGAVLALGLGDGLQSVEADSTDDYRNYAVVTKAEKTDSRSFSSVRTGEIRSMDGPFEWVAQKSKYFLYAVMAIQETGPRFGGAVVVGGARSGKAAPYASVTATLPVPPSGEWRYQVYTGPIEHRRLAALGHGLDDANPYGGILRPIIHPISIFVLNILLWMHQQLGLAYGWVLVLFGVGVRILLWPLNQKAMESSLRMQAVAPLMKDVQERYKGDPERLQREMLKLYREYKVNPLGGCLPMLLPLPVLFALFFVFQNTIEFRGVPFMWLPDLSRHDPLYIIPVLMGLSMFAVSKIGQMGLPPTPQSRLMLYFLPALMTFFFLRFASGLNLYYTVQNIVSIPQQYLLARRRQKQQGQPPVRPPDKRDRS